MLLFKHGTVQPDLAIVFGRSWRETPGRYVCEVDGQGLKCLGQLLIWIYFAHLKDECCSLEFWNGHGGGWFSSECVCSSTTTKVWVALVLAKHWQNLIYQTF